MPLSTTDDQWLLDFSRINIIGTSGSGKSTFAREIAEALGHPRIEMDQLFWKRDWQETPDVEFFEEVESATQGDRWVLDGNYTRTTPIKWARVQLVVWIDLPFWTTVFRVTRRAIRRSRSQEEIWPGTGNRETLRKSFLSRDSIIAWSITTHGKNRAKYRRVVDSPEYAGIHFLHLNSVGRVAQAVEHARSQSR